VQQAPLLGVSACRIAGGVGTKSHASNSRLSRLASMRKTTMAMRPFR
jgi:hypothetical protein